MDGSGKVYGVLPWISHQPGTSLPRPQLYPHVGRVGAGTGEASDGRCLCCFGCGGGPADGRIWAALSPLLHAEECVTLWGNPATPGRILP